ncbi:MAG: ABC transporter ATP-binding protein [Candidatus Thorarchaeota archaeon]
MNPIIEFNNFSWKYKASKDLVLDSINLKINQGEFVGVMGPTGAGKSTLCSCINGLIPSRTRGWIKGDVHVLGQNTRQVKINELGSHVGLVFQDPETQFIMMTVEDEIAIGLETLCLDRKEIKARIEWALDLVGLEGFEQKSPEELSGGQKQLVAIASIMAMRPEILILDEPTSDLDPIGKQNIFKILENIRNEFNLTIILVSHETKKILQFCTRVVLLDCGRILYDGNPIDLMSKEDVIDQSGICNPNKISLMLKKRLLGNKKISELKNSLYNQENVIVKIKNLSYTYPNGTLALKNIDLIIKKGDFISIIGENGSGKTTLIKHINGLLKPQVGFVELKNKSIFDYKISDIAQIIGFCYQNPDHQLFKNTIREEIEFGLKNLKFPQDEINNRYNEIIDLFKLQKFEEVYESTFYLSKGIRQRLALASVLVLKPEILIIDEPTTGQDFLMIQEFMKILQELHAENKTIIIVTHNPYVISQYSNEVIIMKEGNLVKKISTLEFLRDEKLQKIAAFTPI